MSSTKSTIRHPVRMALVMLGVTAVMLVLVFNKPAILTHLRPGEIITVELTRDYKLRPYLSGVKIAGARIGVVQSVEHPGQGPVLMTLKVDNGTRSLLGTEPSAVIQPTTLLGGTYYVQLHPGGQPGTAATNVIPVQRTGLPVELQQMLSAIPAQSRQGTQVAVARFDDALRAGVGAALNKLLVDAPSGLRPTAVVVDAVRGVNKDADLTNLVTDMNTTARTLSAKPGQLRSVVDSMAVTARTFGDNAVPVDQTIATLPATLRSARTGAGDLSRLLDRLVVTADDVRPTVRALDPMLDEIQPALSELRPVLTDLKPLLNDAKPLLDRLAPAVSKTTDVLDDLDGPVLDRVNGPILDALLSEWKGFAPKYPQGGATGNKMYEELAGLVVNGNGALQPFNATSHYLAVWLGVGPTMLQGTGPVAQTLQDYLGAEIWGRPHQKKPLPVGPELPGGINLLPGQTQPGPAVPELNLGSPLTKLGVGK